MKGQTLLCLLLQLYAVSSKENATCNRDVLENQLFNSPNFPHSALEAVDCNYTMKTEPNKKILLTYLDLEVGNGWHCSSSGLLTFYPNGTVKERICGEATNHYEVLSETNELKFNMYKESYASVRGFLARWRSVPDEYTRQPDKGTYLASYPTTLLRGEKETVCVELLNQQGRAEVNLHLHLFKRADKQNLTGDFPYSTPQASSAIALEEGTASKGCLEITVEDKEDKSLFGILNINITDGANFNVETYKYVNIHDVENLTLVQTDKGKYKSGDTVNFRILGLDTELKSREDELTEVNILDSNFRTVKQWKNLALDQGIVQQEFQLLEESPLGRWKIELYKNSTQISSVNFDVEEYVLPRFEVKIKAPPAIIKGSAETVWKVCPVYTHGAPVKGEIKAKFWTPIYYYGSEKKTVEKNTTTSPDQDCLNLTLKREEVESLKSDYNKQINLEIEFIEAGTGAVEKAEHASNNIVDQEVLIEFGSSSNSHILGGFPYSGEIQVMNHDRSPRSGEQLSVCVRLFTSIEAVREKINSYWSMNEDDFVAAIPAFEKLTYRNKCQEVTTDASGRLSFTVPLWSSVPEEVVKLSVKATAVNLVPPENSSLRLPESRLDVDLTHTSSKLAISINSKQKDKLKCNQENMVSVFISGPKGSTEQLSYHIMSGGQRLGGDYLPVALDGPGDEDKLSPGSTTFSVLEDTAATASHVKQVLIPVNVDHRGFPDFQLVVMLLSGNETLLDSNKFALDFCTQHKVDLVLSTQKTTPKGSVGMKISAAPGSMCGLSLVDKSVDLLGNANKITKEKLSDLKSAAKASRTSAYSTNWELNQKCPKLLPILDSLSGTGVMFASNLPVFANCQSLNIQDGKEETSYQQYGITNGGFGVRGSGSSFPNEPQAFSAAAAPPSPAEDSGFSAAQDSPLGGAPSLNQAPLVVRTEFPETWLFSLELLHLASIDAKYITIDKVLTAPDTLTSWTAEAVCMNPSVGLGLAEPQTITVTQDFFSDLRLPFSVKRGEVFPLNISVFNNVEYDLPLSLRITADKVRPEKEEVKLCIKGRTSQVLSLPTRAFSVGDLNLTVSLTIENHDGCTAVEQGVGYTDRLIKPLKVKPEGLPVEKVETELRCLEDKETAASIRFSGLELPEDTVEDSARVWVHVSGDILASTLQNLGNLVNMPTGCGEQNLAGLAPNIYVLQYLGSSSQSSPELEEQAKKYMEVGYNRQQKYRHSSGAYSIWGGSDEKDGSTWLTAFVVKVFSQASQYIKIEEGKLEESVKWLLASQMENGCFERRGYVHSSSLQGGGSENSLSAFVVTALLEAADKFEFVNKSRVMEAIQCIIKGRNETDLYAYTLSTYAANLYKSKTKEGSLAKLELDSETLEDMENMTNYILEKSNSSLPGSRFWDQVSTVGSHWWSYSRSSAVEMTGYNIMSLTLDSRLEEAVDAVKWLARQRNSQGGFVSTQDTVVALQALATYGNVVGKFKTNMEVQVIEKEDQPATETVKLSEDNKQIQQSFKLSDVPSSVDFNLKGSGCVLVQSVLRYNVKESGNPPAFTLGVRYSGDKLTVCTAYTGPRENTDMSILEVELPSGYSAIDPESLANEVDSGVERVEVEDDVVVLYFDQIPKTERCVDLQIRREFKVDELKPARVSVYDYYKTEERHAITYTLELQ